MRGKKAKRLRKKAKDLATLPWNAAGKRVFRTPYGQIAERRELNPESGKAIYKQLKRGTYVYSA